MNSVKSALTIIKRVFIIVLGCLLYGWTTQNILLPNAITSGGVVGIAIIVNELTALPIGLINILMNVPLFLFAWKQFGREFLSWSLIGMLLSSLAVDFFGMHAVRFTSDPMLASLLGGALKGAGLGIVLATGATTGGMDIVAKALRVRFPHVNLGTLILFLNAAVVAGYALVLKNYESAMYSLVSIYVSEQIMDSVLYGSDSSCTCFIISDNSADLIRELISQVHRGVTVLDGEGAYSGKKKQVLMCVIKRYQIVEIKRTVKRLDANAFVILTDAKNVFGKGFEQIAN